MTAATGDQAKPNPPGELPANGRDVNASVSDALARIQARQQRDPATQRFVSGNTERGVTLERSDVFWTEVAPIKGDTVQRIKTQLAIDDTKPETLHATADAWVEASLFRRAMGLRLMQLGGPITSKGKSRALWSAYVKAVELELKLAGQLGFESEAKRVQGLSAAAYIAQRKDGQ